MGTRCLINVYNEGNELLVRLYRQLDGYPTCAGQELLEWLATRKVVNGLPVENTDDTLDNGAGELAAHLVYFLKGAYPSGDIYIAPVTESKWYIDYVYDVRVSSEGIISLDVFTASKQVLVRVPDVKAVRDTGLMDRAENLASQFYE